jgi:hypothetical protein
MDVSFDTFYRLEAPILEIFIVWVNWIKNDLLRQWVKVRKKEELLIRDWWVIMADKIINYWSKIYPELKHLYMEKKDKERQPH